MTRSSASYFTFPHSIYYCRRTKCDENTTRARRRALPPQTRPSRRTNPTTPTPTPHRSTPPHGVTTTATPSLIRASQPQPTPTVTAELGLVHQARSDPLHPALSALQALPALPAPRHRQPRGPRAPYPHFHSSLYLGPQQQLAPYAPCVGRARLCLRAG